MIDASCSGTCIGKRLTMHDLQMPPHGASNQLANTYEHLDSQVIVCTSDRLYRICRTSLGQQSRRGTTRLMLKRLASIGVSVVVRNIVRATAQMRLHLHLVVVVLGTSIVRIP